jgi:hypothetical protein
MKLKNLVRIEQDGLYSEIYIGDFFIKLFVNDVEKAEEFKKEIEKKIESYIKRNSVWFGLFDIFSSANK